MRAAIGAALVAALAAPALAEEPAAAWEGWIVGAPCVAGLKVADCPLRHVDDPVLLLDDGGSLRFLAGAGTGIADIDIDEAYGRRVRLTGTLADGAIRPSRLDLLEKTGAQTFFKGCL